MAVAPDLAPAVRPTSRRRALALAAFALRDRLRLPPKITGSEWADQNRIISPPAAQPGPWRTERAPYLREIMDVACGREYQDVTIVKCSQSGGSEVLLNAIGYYVDQEPSSILVIQPNVKPMAEDFSKDRVAPLFRDTLRLRGLVKDPRSRDSGNTILHKEFPGGHLTIAGANSAAGLASRPIRIVLADEVDRWATSAGSEGDPLSLADARQTTFRHRKKKVKVSSPGNESESRIEKEWALSDQRHYYVPCPHCGHEQPLEWRDSHTKPDIRPGLGDYRLVWEKTGEGDNAVHQPETAAYVCRECACLIDETHKPAMLAAGKWVKHNPSSRRAGFHIAGLLSPWMRWSAVAAKWLAAKADDEQRKTFFNTVLGLLYVQSGEQLDTSKLASRREAYAAAVPNPVGLLTAAIDVQGDRLELEVRGWAEKEESYQIRLERIYGDPTLDEVWNRAAALLDQPWAHESGTELRVRACFVDSGFSQDDVFRFVKTRQGRGVFASKGADNAKQPLSRSTRSNRDGVKVFTINPNTFKDTLFARLKRATPGPGFLHFGPEETTGADDAYFLQFAAETRRVHFENNRPVVSYVNPGKRRNEAIDLYVLNLAALRSLGIAMSQRLGDEAKRVQAEGAKKKAETAAAASPPIDAEPPPRPEPPRTLRRRGSGGGGWWNRQ